ncbi:MAG: hypothetical protein ACFE9R_21195, partial [Candidatus Hermodarchaeota archaeon]
GFIISILLFLSIYILHLVSINIGQDPIPKEYIFIFVPIIPGPMLTDVIILYLFPFGIFLLIYLIAPYLIELLFRISRFSFAFRKKPDYGFLNLGNDFQPSRVFYRVFLVTLFAFGTSAVIVNLGLKTLFRAVPPGLGDIPDALITAEAIFFATFFLTSLSLLLFLPIWLLEDSGLVAYRHYPKQRRTPIIEGVHKFYLNALEVYTGFSTILVLIQVIGSVFPVINPGDAAILTPIILILLPLILTGLLAAPLYCYERWLPKIKNKIHLRLAKYDLPKFSIPTFDELLKENRK